MCRVLDLRTLPLRGIKQYLLSKLTLVSRVFISGVTLPCRAPHSVREEQRGLGEAAPRSAPFPRAEESPQGGPCPRLWNKEGTACAQASAAAPQVIPRTLCTGGKGFSVCWRREKGTSVRERFKSQPTAEERQQHQHPQLCVWPGRSSRHSLNCCGGCPAPYRVPGWALQERHGQSSGRTNGQLGGVQICKCGNFRFQTFLIQHFGISKYSTFKFKLPTFQNPDSSDLEFRKFKSKVQRFPNFESQKFQISETSNSRCGHFKICHFQIQDSNIP